MHLGIATGHGGFHLKEELLARLRAAGHDVVDFGATALNPGDDYPDFVVPRRRGSGGRNARARHRDSRQRRGRLHLRQQGAGHAALISDHFSAAQGVEDAT